MPSRNIQCVDFVSLTPEEQQVTTTSEGFLNITGLPVGRVGVQTYEQEDGSLRRDLRLPKHVFDKNALSSGEGKVITEDHPQGTVNVDNARDLNRGSLRNLRADHARGLVLADITITDREAIEAVNAGKRDLSLGYMTTLVPIEGGVHVGDDAYAEVEADVLQTNIRINHLAIVDAGRANEGRADRPVRIQKDSAGNVIAHGRQPAHSKDKGSPMEEIVIDGVTYKVAKQVADRLSGLERDASAASKEKARADRLEGQLAAMEQKAEQADKSKAEGEAVKARAKWADAASKHAKVLGVKVAELADKTPAEICREAAKKRFPNKDLADKSDEYVAGLLEAASEQAEAGAEDKAQAEDKRDPVGDVARSGSPHKAEASPLADALSAIRAGGSGKKDKEADK